ncbi:MAG: GAF domain-containing sensor histidine kinase [Jatrophihabitans sp.]|uniref:GAF domain-containing sensor histidine kinase n=1 Tax=Jatrophihabitans sp. TaxID=1932789 RepID=UPI0039107D33
MTSRVTPAGAAVDIFAEWRNLLRPLMSSTPEPLPESLGRIASTSDAILQSPYSLIAVLNDNDALDFFSSDGADAAAGSALGDFAVNERVLAAVLGRGDVVRAPGRDGRDADLLAGQSVLGSVLAVPIVYEGRIVGGLFVGRPPEGRSFGSGEESIAELVAGAAAAILRRTRLTQDFGWQKKWLAESTHLTRAVLAGEHQQPLRLLVQRIREMTAAEVVAVVRRCPDDSHEVVEALGPVESYLDGRRVDVRTARLMSLAGQALEQHLLALFPRPTGRPFTRAEIEAATMLAEQLSVALDLAKGRADRERLKLLDDRDRIARDLHDHVIQRLFAIGLTVQSVASQLDGEVADHLLSGVDDLDETIEQIRSTIYRLRGPVLPAPRSVAAKVSDLVVEMEPVLGFAADLEVRGPVEFGIDDEVSDDCIAVLREALTNVARHAHASKVQVTLAVESSTLTLEVTDNGRGIGTGRRRSGLANLRARAEGRQGSMTLEPGDGGGTRLSWTIPLGGPGSEAPHLTAASSEGR